MIENPVRRYSSGPVSSMTPTALRCLSRRAIESVQTWKRGVCKITIHTEKHEVSTGSLGEISRTLWSIVSRKDSEQSEVNASLDGSVGSGLER